jgi:radical SAM enzyme (TIGR01210 family)
MRPDQEPFAGALPVDRPHPGSSARLLAGQDLTEWILSQRGGRAEVDPTKPHGFFLEEERAASGKVVTSAVILLTNKECPWRCLMCDLWKHTLTQTVPPGALPRQIEHALERLASQPEQIKLYNSGSFFDPAAVPVADYSAIADRVGFAKNVVVESHPRLIGERALRFRDLLKGSLEVAMGLETIHPEVLPRLNKRFELTHFWQSAEFLRREGMAVRAFVLVKPPFMSEAEGIEWAVKSVEFAFACGVGAVSLIPTRPGNGALEQLMETGEFSPPRLESLERALELGLNLKGGRVFADTWNLEQFSNCSACLESRRQRLHFMNLTQEVPPGIECRICGANA